MGKIASDPTSSFIPKIVVVIPARGGSKRLPGKNIKAFCGKPLIAWTIDAARKSKYVDRVIVSTDDAKIADIAKKYGAQVPFLRPAELATDTASTTDVVVHALSYLEEKENYRPEFLCLLQPTSPLKTSLDLDNAFRLLLDKQADACVSVVPAKINPYYANKIDKDGFYANYFKPGGRKHVSTLRPEKTYFLNGAIYAVKRAIFLKERVFEPKNTVAYVMDEYSSIDIDTMRDFEVATCIKKMKRMKSTKKGSHAS